MEQAKGPGATKENVHSMYSLKNVQHLRAGYQHAQRRVILHPNSDLTRRSDPPILCDVLTRWREQQRTKRLSQACEQLERLRPLIRRRYGGRR